MALLSRPSFPPEGTEKNLLLRTLSNTDQGEISRTAEYLVLPARKVLFESGQPLRHVYFLTSGIASIVVLMKEGRSVEVNSIGHEGCVGLPVLFHARTYPVHCHMQVGGAAWRLGAAMFQHIYHRSDSFRTAVANYAYMVSIRLSQSVACNLLHSVRQRFSLWLLTSRRQLGCSRVPITHEFLAEMLGVTRTTVTQLIGDFERRGIVRHGYGALEIADQPGLERSVCECYSVLRRQAQLIAREHNQAPLF